ncbi:NADH-dependent flavin oxidoreductase [Methanobrevibacter sp.]|uniref:oxidoreductase n=1 Tax=Methanobrevibacter sp. TaxID=66852 RepID=UPI0025E6C2E8|nr:NADH-dependent flavin oxidoreductase [Methanobrevibacter sp.]MBQ6511261.1 NADH-dependent flavin oxidoreductase [Methanobrevibacter sp.]
MKDIFDNCKIGDLKLKSRVVRTGLWQTQPMSEVYEKYENIAKSGVGLIITELISIYPKDKFSEYSIKSTSPQFMAEAKRLAKITHDYDVPILGQIEFIKYNRGIDLDINVNDLTMEDIRQIQSNIIVAVQKLKLAGFDGVQLALGNNFFFSKFINPYFNQRSDDYGGNTFNRTRIVLELIKVMKNNFNFHIGCKVNAFDGRKGGIDPSESIEICKLLEKVGVDSIQVTKPLSPLYFTKDVSDEKELVEFCQNLIDEVEIPVILGGGFDDMAHMNEVINQIDIGLLSMYRPFVADEGFLKSWKDNGEGKSRCKKCNNCYRTKTSQCFHY